MPIVPPVEVCCHLPSGDMTQRPRASEMYSTNREIVYSCQDRLARIEWRGTQQSPDQTHVVRRHRICGKKLGALFAARFDMHAQDRHTLGANLWKDIEQR